MSTGFRLYNTLTNSTDEVQPKTEGHLKFYSCGPTVYSYAHIGNFRSFITADLILRTAKANGWDVTYATNVTDVGHLTEDDLTDPSGEDRMEKALRSKEGEHFVNIWDLARYYTDTLVHDWNTLNLREPTVRPRATEHMREQISAVEKLIKDGHAYETDKGVYFSVTSFPDYGKLSGNTLDNDLEEAVRDVVVDEGKKDPRDFALWKKDDKHLMQWHSPWGWGFPGWHIECSVMAMSYLGEEIDVHAGGEDLIFPHHECEIAQSESLTGKPFATIWAHTRFLQVEGEKMSKSLGNFFTVRDLTAPESVGGKGLDPLAVRMTLLSGHYRKPFNFTMKTLKGNVKHRERLQEVIDLAGHPEVDGTGSYESETGRILEGMYTRAFEAMLDDLNTPAALASLFGGTKMILGRADSMTDDDKASARRWLADMNALLGVVYHEHAVAAQEDDDPLAAQVEPLLEERSAARANGDWGRADEIRDELTALGVEIKDSAEGTTWKRRSNI